MQCRQKDLCNSLILWVALKGGGNLAVAGEEELYILCGFSYSVSAASTWWRFWQESFIFEKLIITQMCPQHPTFSIWLLGSKRSMLL